MNRTVCRARFASVVPVALAAYGLLGAAPVIALPTLAELQQAAPNAPAEPLRRALGALACRDDQGGTAATLTVIDYSLPSTATRLWTFDLDSVRLLFEERVAHGQGTGDNHATRFSNVPGSKQTSLGLFRTAEPYVGRNGYSLRMDGLDRGVNDRARERAIVIHGAPYVSDGHIANLGRLGRSWGCPAVRREAAQALIDTIKHGSYVYSWHPSLPERPCGA